MLERIDETGERVTVRIVTAFTEAADDDRNVRCAAYTVNDGSEVYRVVGDEGGGNWVKSLDLGIGEDLIVTSGISRENKDGGERRMPKKRGKKERSRSKSKRTASGLFWNEVSRAAANPRRGSRCGMRQWHGQRSCRTVD